MIAVRNEDIVAERRTVDGRFIFFTKTDVQPYWPLRWWGTVCDTGGDGLGLLVRLDAQAAPSGWTARQLLVVARRRLVMEGERLPLPATREAVAALDRAAALPVERLARQAEDNEFVTFRPSRGLHGYPWRVASQGGFDIPMCPDPQSIGEGVTPEQLLIIIEQLLHDAARVLIHPAGLARAQRHVAEALDAEVRRLAVVRG